MITIGASVCSVPSVRETTVPVAQQLLDHGSNLRRVHGSRRCLYESGELRGCHDEIARRNELGEFLPVAVLVDDDAEPVLAMPRHEVGMASGEQSFAFFRDRRGTTAS